MARLEGQAPLLGPAWFSLQPVKTERDGDDCTEYALAFGSKSDAAAREYRFSVADWQMGHDDIWIVARAFAEAPVLADAKIPVDLWRNHHNSVAYLYESATWIHAILWGNEKQHRVAIRLFVKDADDPALFRTFFLQTAMESARAFGLQLESEISDAAPNWAAESGYVICL